MVPEKYRLEAVGRHLLEMFERKRPAIAKWDEATARSLCEDADYELDQMQRQLTELGVDDGPYWARVRDTVRTVIVPRYSAVAAEENRLAQAHYGLWRGGDIVMRALLAVVFLVLGAAAVAIPWIPVTEKWVPWLLFILGPFFPDAYLWWYHRQYQRKLDQLLGELKSAGESHETYRPLSEVQHTLGLDSPPVAVEPPAASDPTRTRNRG